MSIQRVTMAELSAAKRQLVERARGAINSRNFAYAIEILRGLLRETPGCHEVRQILRSAQFEKHGGTVGAMAKAMAGLKTAMPLSMKGPKLLRKGRIAEALDLAEGLLEADPSSVGALHFLHKAAVAGGLTDEAAEALELCRRFNPKHEPTLRLMVDFFQQQGEMPRALQALQQLNSLKPNDLGLQTELKQLTATAAMQKGNWENADSYRDVIRDKEQARTLEQQERVDARDEETLASLIEAAKQALAEQETAGNCKRLADLYRKHKDFDEALAMYEKGVELAGTLDPVIEDSITGVLMEQYDDAIRQWREYAGQGDEQAREAEAQIADIEQQKHDTRLERYVQRVARYPNETRYHFELGELHYQDGEYDKALQEFQFAQKNPQLKSPALVYIGRCMAAKGLTDMAVEQIRAALECGPQRMNRERKEIVYTLACLEAEAGNAEEALALFKELYASDVNYKDVGVRIEAYYKKGPDA